MGWRTSLSPCVVNIPATTHSPLAETVYLGVLPVCTFLLEFIAQLLDVWWARSSLTGTIKELQACRWRVKNKVVVLQAVWDREHKEAGDQDKNRCDVYPFILS